MVQHTIEAWENARLGEKDIGSAVLLRAADDRFDWAAIEADTTKTYLLQLLFPERFYGLAPKEWGRPTAAAPHHGVPSHVWLGTQLDENFATILKTWPTKRFLIVPEEENQELLESVFSYTRCSICGTRYDEPTLLCQRINLCGDAPLIPQIEVFLGAEWAKEMVLERGGKWLS